MKVAGLIVSIFIVVTNSLKLPEGFRKCNKGNQYFDNCLSHAIHDAIELLDKSYLDYGLPSLEAFLIPGTVEIGSSIEGLKQIYSNIKMTGLTKIKDVKARMDFKDNILNLKLCFDELKIEEDVDIFGNLLILPVNSSGTFSAKYIKPVFKFTFQLSVYKKNNTQFYELVKTHLDKQVESIIFDYKNIFQNKSLNNALNAELKANWKMIFDFLCKAYSKTFANLYGGLFNNLLLRIPISELFDGVYHFQQKEKTFPKCMN